MQTRRRHGKEEESEVDKNNRERDMTDLDQQSLLKEYTRARFLLARGLEYGIIVERQYLKPLPAMEEFGNFVEKGEKEKAARGCS